jgi:L-fuculose-phosphate aldolase
MSLTDQTWAPPALELRWNPPDVPGLTPRGEVAAACRFLYDIGYDEHMFGHITWKQPDGTYLTNAYEITWDQICASHIVAVDEVGRKAEEHPLNPSAGLNLHASLRLQEPGSYNDCIIHAHPQYGIMWAIRGEAPPIYDQGSAWIGDEVYVTADPLELWLNPGDAKAVKDHGWALMARHGVIAATPTIEDAIYRLAILEHRSRVAWMLENRNATPMTAEQAAAIPTFMPPNYTRMWWNAAMRQQIERDSTLLK